VPPIFSERLGEILNQSIRNGHRLSIPEEVRSSIKMVSPELKTKVENFYLQDFELLDFGSAD
jgi:hypothetical protein